MVHSDVLFISCTANWLGVERLNIAVGALCLLKISTATAIRVCKAGTVLPAYIAKICLGVADRNREGQKGASRVTVPRGEVVLARFESLSFFELMHKEPPKTVQTKQ